MTEFMTPSEIMTDKQINKAVANYRALLEKHAGEFGREVVQAVLGQSEFADKQFAVFRRRVEEISKTIIRHVRVNRTRTAQQAFDATGRGQYMDESVVAEMPKGDGEEVELHYFDLDYNPTVDELDREFQSRGLVPDPIALAADNEANPALADDCPSATQWRDENGKACYASFSRNVNGGRNVNVCRDGHRWTWCSRFAGVRK